MEIAAAIALASLTITIIVGFAVTMRALGRIEERIDLLWRWYLAECGPGIPGGRRRTDPAMPFEADDRSAPGDPAV